MLFIFLDIDGVLNTEADWVSPYTLNKECANNFLCFASLYNSRIILTSTWKHGYISSNNRNNTNQIKQLEAIFNTKNIRIIGKTEDLMSRDIEISKYIIDHNITKYIILDDDATLFQRSISHMYFTNSKYGFSKKDIKEVTKCI